MSRKKTYLTATDCFCGAGGSSQGITNAGVQVEMALNHWKLAIETHNTNFPNTRHDCTDVSACDPRRYPSTDLGIFSPECTTHSPAGGNNHKTLKKQIDMFDSGAIDPATERSRATMWDVCRFAEYHQYNCIIVENVVEAKTRWALFDVWLNAMHVLGYMHRLVFHNSMHHHPTPQSRDRMYIVFWKAGNKAPVLDYMPSAHCPKCLHNVKAVQTWKDKRKNWGKYRTQYVYCCPACSSIVEPYYYAAFNCIDWSDIGKRIGSRKKPLADKTIARIKYGLDKYGRQPMIVRNQTPGYCRPVNQQVGTITTDDTNGVLNTPYMVDNKQTTGIGFRVRSATNVTCTMHTEPGVGLISPFLIDSAYGGTAKSLQAVKGTQTTQHTEGLLSMPFVPVARGKSMAHSSLAPISTQSQMINHGVVTTPMITELRGTGKARPASRELNGITANGINSGIVTTESWNSFISYYNAGSNMASGINEATGTQATKDRMSLVSYQVPAIEDCYYRMLFPREIKLAMAFGADYIVLGSSKDQVKQLGNAVTPPAMEWLVQQCVKSLS